MKDVRPARKPRLESGAWLHSAGVVHKLGQGGQAADGLVGREPTGDRDWLRLPRAIGLGVVVGISLWTALIVGAVLLLR